VKNPDRKPNHAIRSNNDMSEMAIPPRIVLNMIRKP